MRIILLCLPFFLAVPASSASTTTALGFPDGKTISVEVVSTPEARQRGLMFRKKLPKDYGMLFVFPWETGMQFWMKNTYVSLDIVFIDSHKKVTSVFSRVKPSTAKTKDDEVARAWGVGRYVLELPAGEAEKRGLKAGAELVFSVQPSKR